MKHDPDWRTLPDRQAGRARLPGPARARSRRGVVNETRHCDEVQRSTVRILWTPEENRSCIRETGRSVNDQYPSNQDFGTKERGPPA